MMFCYLVKCKIIEYSYIFIFKSEDSLFKTLNSREMNLCS